LVVGAHASPAVQATHAPALQTRFVPQDVPLATFPDSTHTGAPVLHAVAPVLHGLPVTAQLRPDWQAMQLPVELQTSAVPQLVPAGTSVALSLQTGVPVEQACVP
jgi:hypothetical protein